VVKVQMQFSYIADIYSHLYASQIVENQKGWDISGRRTRIYYYSSKERLKVMED
jgi:DNA phosphorothioation-dependent restriction protein DptG